MSQRIAIIKTILETFQAFNENEEEQEFVWHLQRPNVKQFINKLKDDKEIEPKIQ